ncbi:anti-sigma factor family protein [Wukongibacter sp. M2B1]|uniref:anti-sigma factor family protein n=1 Tax=Wukongibacter sp. M2B1 TaxID=3088895 RepID=UPI003D7B9197
MECKTARYWMSIYIDKELEVETENKLFKHIDECEECSIYFQQFFELNNQIEQLFKLEECNSDKIRAEILKSIENERKKQRRKRVYSKLAICAVILIGILMTIPINGKTVLAHVNDWAKGFIIREPGLIIKVENRDNKKTKDLSSKTYSKLKVDENMYYSTEELNEKIYKVEKKTCLPPYLPTGYEFKYALYEKYFKIDSGSFSITTYFERDNIDTNTKEYMNIQISYDGVNTSSQSVKYYTDINKDAKPIKIDGENAILIKEKTEEVYKTYKLYCIMNSPSAKVEVQYKSHKVNSNVEEEITKVANELVKKIKKEVPENNIKPRNISEVIKSYSEKEFYDEVYNIDDRIVKIDFIPEDYKFDWGTFINNPKEEFNIPSDYNSCYIKGDSRINIEINYYNYTNLDSDFPSNQIGEVEKRESLLGYEMKLYKERKSLAKYIRSISITLPDYSMVIKINTQGSKDEILELEDMKKISVNIIEKVHKRATKTKTVRNGNYTRNYDSVKHLRESSKIVYNGFVVPSYKPKGYEFMRAKYTNTPNRYLLQFIQIREASDSESKLISISEKVGDITSVRDSRYVSSIEETTILGYKGYIVKEKSEEYDSIELQIGVAEKNHLIQVKISHYESEEGLEDELVKIAKSMLKQIE